MKNKRKLTSLGIILTVFVVTISCGFLTASPEPTATPTDTPSPEPTAYPTYTPYPEPTAYPTFTPYPTHTPYPSQILDISNLFCEYDFCIGHPATLYLTDPSGIDQVDEWNIYGFGILVGVNDILMILEWDASTEAEWDAKFEIEDMLADGEVIRGDVNEETVGDFMVTYVEYEHMDPSTMRPYGVAAAWFCGNRGFLLDISTQREGKAMDLAKQSIERFTCQ